MSFVTLVALGLAMTAPLSAKFSPMQADKFLVAGSSDKGWRDGEFWQAAFDQPQGLALSQDGKSLYVGDVGNRAIRVVSLQQNNAVSTRWRMTGTAKTPLDASELAVLGGDLFFVPSDGRGLWRLPEGASAPLLLAGSSSTAGTVSGPLVVSPWAEVLWLDLAAPGGARLKACNVLGLTRSASAAIAGLAPGDGSRLTSLEGQPYVIHPLGQLSRLDLAGGLGAVFIQGVSEAAATLTPMPVSLAGMDWPFPVDGKGCFLGWEARTSGLKVAYPQGLTVSVALQDQVGGMMSDINVGAERGPGSALQYPWVIPGGRAIFDRARRKAYFADAHHRHIVGWAWTDPGFDPEHWEYYYIGPPISEPKDPDIQHLLVLCNSLFVGVSDRTPHTIRKSMWKQFELQLNMLNALAGTGRRYVVPVKGGSVGITKGVTSFAVTHMDEFVKLGTDDLLICVEPKALVCEMLYLLEGPQTDDLLAPEVDPEWVTQSNAEHEAGWGPLTKEMVALFDKDKVFFHDLIRRDAKGKMALQSNEPARYFANTKFTQLVLKFQDKMLGKLEAAAKGRPFKVRFLIMPFSRAGAPGDIQGGMTLGDQNLELNTAFAALAHAHGFGVVDMVPSFRVLGPTLMPFYYDNDHYIVQGHMWLGQVAAQLYFNEIQAEPPK
jgi:hypothetical protein